MKSGIYALASLNGAPLSPADLETMGLPSSDGIAIATDQRPAGVTAMADGLAVHAWDAQPEALDLFRTGEALTVLAGFLDEPEELRASLGAGAAETPAQLAAAALARWGRETPVRMLGEWTLLHWEARRRQLTLLSSEALRDRTHFALHQGRIALAPEALRLGRLPWVGLALDPAGLAFASSRAGLRHTRTDQTMWRYIHALQPGTREIFREDGRTTDHAPGPEPPERWAGSFEEAVEAIEAVGRRIVRQQMTRQGRSAFFLSGGLDSTLLTSWGAYERGTAREMFCVSSMAPPGSGLEDESEWSLAAAESLGVELQGVWPAAESNLFRPSVELYRRLEGPADHRFNVYSELQGAALTGGATAVLDGMNGEMHVTAGFAVPETLSWLRIRGSQLLDAVARRPRYCGWPAEAFHLRFSPQVLAQLPGAWGAVWRKGPPRVSGINTGWAAGDPPIGISPVARKMSAVPTEGDYGVRHLLPYRDQRLLRLTAQIPAGFLQHGGQTRSLARAMLKGRVPDSVRLRSRGRPFSPDYTLRFKTQATEVAERTPIFRASGVGRWVDLDWLDQVVSSVARSNRNPEYGTLYTIQGTALLAEFLLWATTEGLSL